MLNTHTAQLPIQLTVSTSHADFTYMYRGRDPSPINLPSSVTIMLLLNLQRSILSHDTDVINIINNCFVALQIRASI